MNDVIDDQPEADEQGDQIREIGMRLARFRAERGLTLTALAEASDLSIGMISQLERGQRNPSVATIQKLAIALGMPFTAFFIGDAVEASPTIIREATRRRFKVGQNGIEYEVLTPNERGTHGVYVTRLPPGWSGADHPPFSHEGEQTHVVLEGTKVLTVADREYRLEVGDSITFDSLLPHWSSNPGDVVTVSLACLTPPGF